MMWQRAFCSLAGGSMTAFEKAIDVKNIGADYGGGFVIRNVSFDVRKGETFGLIGLNGVGKTTLIKIMLGLLTAREGQIDLFGVPSTDPEAKMRLAYLPEKFEPPHFLSGREFIDFSVKLYGRRVNDNQVNEAADRLDLARGALDRRVNTYSKGMRQKTGLLGTWLTESPLLILDEPMSGLDPRARAKVKDELKAYKARGVTVFMSSHILADMDEICDRVAIIHAGALQFLGTPTELKQQMGEQYLERAFLQRIDAVGDKAFDQKLANL
jgi:ABC-2 type transport system ATP-binding protein